MTIRHFALSSCLAVALTSCTCSSSGSKEASTGVQITKLDDRLRVEIGGKLFTEYHFKNTPRPYCYPVLGPEELPMTRDWPMKDTPGETHDHPHHRSLWFAHGSVDGQDFWSEQKEFGTTVHESFSEIRSGEKVGVIRSKNKWVARDGSIKCTDERTLRFYNLPANERMLDFDITIHASHGDLTFGDTKEGTMAMRLAETMRLKPNPTNVGKPTGHIVNSNGIRDGETWGKRADWCDYYGPVQGKIVGVAIFDNPQNPRHPTWWHVRDYGLFAANPFGEHDFEGLKNNKTAGNLVIPAGKSVTFRYRFYFHEGNEIQGKVAEHYTEYVKCTSKNN